MSWYVCFGETPYNQSVLEGTKCRYYHDALAELRAMRTSNNPFNRAYYDSPYVGVMSVESIPRRFGRIHVYTHDGDKLRKVMVI